jgi:Mn2+/Fe2+ NRAMP family transporter
MRDPRPRPDPILKLLGRRADVPRQEQFDDSAADEGVRPDLGDASRRGPLALLRVLGPGVITGAADDDPSAIGSYSQAGAQAGLGMLWTGLLALPVMVAVQELAQRIALQTGAGLGVNLRLKFPSWLVAAAVLVLVASNVITLGADLQAVAAGGELLSRGLLRAGWLIAPIAVAIVGFQVFGKYQLLFKTFRWLTLALFAYVFCALVVHPDGHAVLIATFLPHLEMSKAFLLTLVAVLGTTFSPYLFIWQPAEEVDNLRAQGRAAAQSSKPVDDRELRSARVDTLIGMVFSQAVAYYIVLTAAVVLHTHGKSGVASAAEAAQALAPVAGPVAFAVFAVGLIGSGILSIPVLSASAAYAVNEVAGIPGSLAGKPRYQPTFYSIIVVATAIGVAMNLVHLNVIQALVIASALSGIAAVPMLVLMTLFGSDGGYMAERKSGRLSLGLTWLSAAGMVAATLALLVTLVTG